MCINGPPADVQWCSAHVYNECPPIKYQCNKKLLNRYFTVWYDVFYDK